MRSIKAVFSIIILISLFIAGCGRPGGSGEENAPGSYLQVTSVTLSGDKATIKVKNIFKDPSVTTPNSMYDVTLTGYEITYFNANGSPILTALHNNSIFVYLPVKGDEVSFELTLVPSPSSISFSSASVHIYGTNHFGDKIGATFLLPTFGGGGGTTTTGNKPTVSNVTFVPSTVIAGNTFNVTATVSDPDGLSDISIVTLDASQVGSGTVQLFDDGNHGDSGSGDGIYGKEGITVVTGTSAGSYTLTVTATDKSGNTGQGSGTLTVQ